MNTIRSLVAYPDPGEVKVDHGRYMSAEEIKRARALLANGWMVKDVAAKLGRHKDSIMRAIRREQP